MRRCQKSIFELAVIAAFITGSLIIPCLVVASDLEPPGPQGPTMKTRDQIPSTWSQKLPASERFELVLDDAAVLDKETGLVWAKNANIASEQKTWQSAINYCRNVNIGGRKGWRLPTVEELLSLVDEFENNPALADGHPFNYVQPSYYWSSTTFEGSSDYAWRVIMANGHTYHTKKVFDCYVWPVRGGN